MKNIYCLLMAMSMTICTLSLTACGDDDDYSRFKKTVNDTKEYKVGDVSFKMIAVDEGSFMMGATSEQGSDAYESEMPHHVTLNSYRIGETEVTQALWRAVMGSNPSYFEGDNRPVETVSWNDCQTFIRKLNAATEGQRPKGREFRLPTEAEWEFAARGGNKSNHTK